VTAGGGGAQRSALGEGFTNHHQLAVSGSSHPRCRRSNGRRLPQKPGYWPQEQGTHW